jgi:hypothetical protein
MRTLRSSGGKYVEGGGGTAGEAEEAEIMRDLLLERVSKLEEEARGASAHYGPDAKLPRY